MHSFQIFKRSIPGFMAAMLALAPAAFAQEKKAPAPAKPAVKAPAAPAKPAAAGAAKPGGAAAAAHGPTTAGAHTGPTTAGAHGPTTGAPHAAAAGGAHPAMAGGHPTPNNRVVSHPGVPERREVRTAHGDVVRRDQGGHLRDVHVANRNMDIHRTMNGNRRIEVERADHSRVFAERGGRGYIEHPYRYGGRDFGHRTYYYHGRVYDHYYARYQYRGVYVNYYTPAYYYRPAFYGWAYNPWVAPVPYAWGFAATPWYGQYGYYFTPAPVYPSASVWLADYMVSASLAAAYEAQAAPPPQSAPPQDAAPMTPEVRNLISAEVQRQIALENAEATTAQSGAQAPPAPDPASSSIQRSLSDNIQHVFVVGADIDVVNAQGTECEVTQGDALQLQGPPPADAQTASLIVLSSKGGTECKKSDVVSVQVADLQEMQNHMRETIDAGMGELQAKQGKGLPTLPASAAGEPVKAGFMSEAPKPDENVKTEINQQLAAADQAEKEVVAQAPPDNGAQQVASATGPSADAAPAAAPTQVDLTGKTPAQVIAAMGQPVKILDKGIEKDYVYKDIKVIFKNGKVVDEQ